MRYHLLPEFIKSFLLYALHKAQIHRFARDYPLDYIRINSQKIFRFLFGYYRAEKRLRVIRRLEQISGVMRVTRPAG